MDDTEIPRLMDKALNSMRRDPALQEQLRKTSEALSVTQNPALQEQLRKTSEALSATQNPALQEQLRKTSEALSATQNPALQEQLRKTHEAFRLKVDPDVWNSLTILVKPSPEWLEQARQTFARLNLGGVRTTMLDFSAPQATMVDFASRLEPLGPDALGELVQNAGEALLASWPSAAAEPVEPAPAVEPVEPAPDAVAALWLLWTFALAYMAVFYGDEMPEGVEKCIDFALVALGYVAWLRGGRRP